MAKKNRSNASASSAGRGASERKAAAARVLAEQRKQARRRALLWQGGIAVVVIAIVAGVTVGVLQQKDKAAAASGATPAGLTKDGAIRFGAADAPVTLQAVEDFQCPACKAFEASTGDQLAGYREGKEVAVEYRPIAFLDRASSTKYSTRALNASMCVLEASDKQTWLKYHEALYTGQPAEGGAGLPDSTLRSMAADVGVEGDDVTACIDDVRYRAWSERQTQAAFDDGVSGTPTLFVDGKKLDGSDGAAITQAIEDARS